MRCCISEIQKGEDKVSTHTNIAELKQGQRPANVFEELMSRPHVFDPDAYHVMQQRDDELIRDELLHGDARDEFVYRFKVQGSEVTGISVVGARELASTYKGIKARIVASTEKRGSLFVFRTFEPLGIETRDIPELEEDTDFYEVVMEITDIKSGNSIQVRKSEMKTERRRDGTTYDRPHYSVIAESKAFRNGVLSVLPQRVIQEFKRKCLAGGKGSEELTIGQLRDRTAAFCAKNGISLARGALADLSYAELRGLASSAGTSIESFKEAADALGIVAGKAEAADVRERDAGSAKGAAQTNQPQARNAQQQGGAIPGAGWTPDPEEEAAIRAAEMAEAQQSEPQRAPRGRGRQNGFNLE